MGIIPSMTGTTGGLVNSGQSDTSAIDQPAEVLARRKVEALLRNNRPDEARALLEKELCTGTPSKSLIDFAVEMYLRLRDYKLAYWYAERACYDFDSTGKSLLRLAYVATLNSSFNLATNWLHEYLASAPDDFTALDLLTDCYVRQRRFSDALEVAQGNGRLGAGDRHSWLGSMVDAGSRLPRVDWFGRRMKDVPKRLSMDWKKRILLSPLSYYAKRIEDVDSWINTCRYVSDQRLFGEVDHWQTPKALEENRRGDCEDFALWAWAQLVRIGYRARFMIGSVYGTEINHAWVCLFGDQGCRIFECVPQGHNVPISSRSASEYIPYFSVDNTLKWFKHRT